jgi:hypothetical protein
MPEDQEKNNQENQSETEKDQSSYFRGVTPESKKKFEDVLEEVRRGMETQVNEENAEVLNPNSLLSTVGENAARKVAGIAAEKYKKRINFERTNLGFQKPQNSPRASEVETEEGGAGAAEAAKRAEIRKTAQEEAKKNLDAEQQGIAIRIAGDRAMSIFQKIADEMAEVAEGGGIMGEIIILFTFILAIAKDLTDGLLVTLAAASLPIPVFDIVFPVSVKLLSWIIGFAASTILIFFWMIVAGNWKGGLVTNWILKTVLRFLIGGLMESVIGILPIYTILNIWCYSDYRNEQRKGTEEEEAAKEKIEFVRRDVSTSIDRINAASS